MGRWTQWQMCKTIVGAFAFSSFPMVYLQNQFVDVPTVFDTDAPHSIPFSPLVEMVLNRKCYIAVAMETAVCTGSENSDFRSEQGIAYIFSIANQMSHRRPQCG